MFALFYNLILAMFKGQWVNYSFNNIMSDLGQSFGSLAQWIGSLLACISPHLDGITDEIAIGEANTAIVTQPFIFADGLMGTDNFLKVISCIIALITCIGIVVVATKGIKKLFTVFFYGVR